MIELENVTVSYDNGKTPVKGFTLTLPERGVAALTGASGCGKTTVLRLAAGLIKPTSGEVRGLSGKRLSMVFQEDRLLEWLNVKDNVLFAGANAKNDIDAARVWLDAVELSGRENDALTSLSGGMKRRVAIARALCFGGDVIFMDEPYKGLDEALAARVHEKVKERFPLVVAAVHEKHEAQALHADLIVEM
jgi:NitT/TauT family transport system ATP-binding protein